MTDNKEPIAFEINLLPTTDIVSKALEILAQSKTTKKERELVAATIRGLVDVNKQKANDIASIELKHKNILANIATNIDIAHLRELRCFLTGALLNSMITGDAINYSHLTSLNHIILRLESNDR